MEKLKTISFETEGITVLNATEMNGTMGGSTFFCASSLNCITAVFEFVAAATAIFATAKACEQEVVEDTSSRIIVDGMCELDASVCYSYA